MIKLKLVVIKSIQFIWLSALALLPLTTMAQNEFESILKNKMDSLVSAPGPVYAKPTFMPNNSIQSIMTPSGWGGNGSYLFAVVGGVYPALYTQKADMIGSMGLSFGNSEKHVNVSASINVGRLKILKDFSYNFVVSRQLKKGNSISIGALQLFSDPAISDSPDGSYYIAFSHSSQNITPKTPGYSPLTYTIGIGNGRFLLKSPWDVRAGKGKYGTAVFANVSYEVFKDININVEWSGTNLGLSTGFRPFPSNLTVGLGIYNLTQFSGDKPSMLGSIGYPLSLKKTNSTKNRSNNLL